MCVNICLLFHTCAYRSPPPPSLCAHAIVYVQPVRLWTGKQVIGCLLRPNKRSPVVVNLRARGKQYSTGEDLCHNDSCEDCRHCYSIPHLLIPALLSHTCTLIPYLHSHPIPALSSHTCTLIPYIHSHPIHAPYACQLIPYMYSLPCIPIPCMYSHPINAVLNRIVMTQLPLPD